MIKKELASYLENQIHCYSSDLMTDHLTRKNETFEFHEFTQKYEPNYLRQILVVPHFLSSNECFEISKWAQEQESWEWLKWRGVDDQVPNRAIGRCNANLYSEYIQKFAQQYVLPNYNMNFTGYYSPKIHWYKPGCSLAEHWDNGYMYQFSHGKEAKELGKYGVSILIYLNQDWQGGELYFPYYGVKLNPSAGTAICFPSNHEFSHRVENIVSGERLAMLGFVGADQ